ncbi:hypothetical protein [Stutzerimonas stutzeri]|uniref:hypothetical protein n=1 Tax=Stutzerimonas stutzeri TaxID=316 RepID=UPI0011AFB62F|nr:hypothetical protein [Stutzerimonas stutzeri]MCQ4264133.1 hypothetical protein [Stutzerimonas stutzeri]
MQIAVLKGFYRNLGERWPRFSKEDALTGGVIDQTFGLIPLRLWRTTSSRELGPMQRCEQ